MVALTTIRLMFNYLCIHLWALQRIIAFFFNVIVTISFNYHSSRTYLQMGFLY